MVNGLSARQEECLRLTALLTDKEIAARLGLSEATIKKHVHEACRRLGVNRRKAGLALLERNVPATKDPIAADRSVAASARPDGIGGGVDGIGSDGGGRPPAHASPAGVEDRDDRGPPPPPSMASAEPGGRFGYRPPPRGWGFRVLMIAIVVVLGAVLAKAVADLVVAYTHQVRAIDRAAAAPPSPAP